MKTIFITISRGALVRNFFQTGVVRKLLDRGARVVVITPYFNHSVFARDSHENLIFEPYVKHERRFQRILNELFKAAVFNKTVRFRFKYRVTGRSPSRAFYYIRLLILAPISFIPKFKEFIRLLESVINPEHQYDFLFEKYKPDLVFTTAAVGDIGLLKSAKRFGVKTVDMPKSWDGLSKTLFPVKADRLLVWNSFMQDQAIKFQGYAKDQVVVTGIPQFDFYNEKKRLLTRDDFCRKFGLDPRKKIILYGSTGGNCCVEGDYVTLLHEYMEEKKLSGVQVLIRPHVGYANDAERFYLAKDYQGIVIDETARSDDTFRDKWDVSEEFVNIFVNSLHHADLCVNIASTITLDAIACGIPVININFDVKKRDMHWSTKRLFLSDYIEEITNLGGTWVAKSKEEFLVFLKKLLYEPQAKEEKMDGVERIKSRLIYKTDGKSADRVAQSLLFFLGLS